MLLHSPLHTRSKHRIQEFLFAYRITSSFFSKGLLSTPSNTGSMHLLLRKLLYLLCYWREKVIVEDYFTAKMSINPKDAENTQARSNEGLAVAKIFIVWFPKKPSSFVSRTLARTLPQSPNARGRQRRRSIQLHNQTADLDTIILSPIFRT